jgi:hypothetical protein
LCTVAGEGYAVLPHLDRRPMMPLPALLSAYAPTHACRDTTRRRRAAIEVGALA